MYLFHYYIEYIRKCFNDTYNKENEINLQKKNRLPSLAIGISLLTN